jgi:hypothetical protein
MSECEEMQRDTYELEHVNRLMTEGQQQFFLPPEITSILTVAAKRIPTE